MLFQGKRLQSITESDIQRLIDEAVEEGRDLDYKLELPTGQTESKKEFAHDVISLANSAGGHLVYGVREENAAPVEIVGLTNEGIERNILQMDSWIRDSIAPRISGTHIFKVPCESGKVVLVVEVPKSWNTPHMARNSSQFYARNSKGKYQLDVMEIRSAVLASESLGRQIRDFRSERLAKLIANDFTIAFEDSALVVLHVCPLVSFTHGFSIDLTRVPSDPELASQPQPLGTQAEPLSSRFVFDGRLLVASSGLDPASSHASSLLFRNGIIETVNSRLLALDDRSRFIAGGVESSVSEALESYLPLLARLGATPPWVVLLSLLNVHGYRMESATPPSLRARDIDRDHLLLPEALFEDEAVSASTSMRPIYDIFWNACGIQRCLLYSPTGEWLPITDRG